MDEDELAVLQKSNVKTKADYDTFGDTAAELAQRAAAADAQARPSAIPGAVFQDLIAPVPDSVGTLSMCAGSLVRLLSNSPASWWLQPPVLHSLPVSAHP